MFIQALEDLDENPTFPVEIPLVAKQSKNNAFHSLFKQLPLEEMLVEDFSCALQREILVQGRMYLTGAHICFHAAIFGWVTTVKIPLVEVIAVEKRTTALIFPNAIEIVTATQKYFFGSFIFRELAFNLIFALWKKACRATFMGGPGDALDIGSHRKLTIDPLQTSRPYPPLGKAGTCGDFQQDMSLDFLLRTPISGASELSAWKYDDERSKSFESVVSKWNIYETKQSSNNQNISTLSNSFNADQLTPNPMHHPRSLSDSSLNHANVVIAAQSLRRAASSTTLEETVHTRQNESSVLDCGCTHYDTIIITKHNISMRPTRLLDMTLGNKAVKSRGIIRWVVEKELQGTNFSSTPWAMKAGPIPFRDWEYRLPNQTRVAVRDTLVKHSPEHLVIQTRMSVVLPPSGTTVMVEFCICFSSGPQNRSRVLVSVNTEILKGSKQKITQSEQTAYSLVRQYWVCLNRRLDILITNKGKMPTAKYTLMNAERIQLLLLWVLLLGNLIVFGIVINWYFKKNTVRLGPISFEEMQEVWLHMESALSALEKGVQRSSLAKSP
jgi:hypothetical protein